MPYVYVPARRRRRLMRRGRYGGRRSYRSSFRRRRTSYGRASYRPRGYRSAGRGRYRGRARRARRQVRLVIQQPSDMLPIRPVAGQFARMRRRARF